MNKPETENVALRPRLDFPQWSKPPLSLNHRFFNHGHRARVTREVRQAGYDAAVAADLPRNVNRAVVRLHYRPNANRKIDTINLSPTTKAIVDGLIDYGLAADDNHELVSTPEPEIHPAIPGRRRGEIWITLEFPEEAPG